MSETTTMHDRCEVCGGNAGRLSNGRHELCAARQARGLATPSLGDRCAECAGSGHLPRPQTGLMLPLDLGPRRIRDAIEAWAPTCSACGGTGHVGGDGRSER